jgi:multiple sugar transport system ATP-binding protein
VNGVADGPVVLGVRPEDLMPAGGDSPVFTSARPGLIENLGHESLVHFEVAGAPQIARLPAEAASGLGDSLPLMIRSDAYHLFSADDEGRSLRVALS